MSEPERPASVPAGAVYNDESMLWELAERDERGLLHGAFAAFDTKGALFSRGEYREGKLDGTVSRFTDGVTGSRPLRACCVPPGARELRTRYRDGVFLDETFFDAQGRALCDDGTPWPERAPSVPPSARYEPHNGRYLDRVDGAADSTTLRVYFPNGTLDEEVELTAGLARVHRRFAPDGACREASELDERGARHGTFFTRFADDEARYLDPRVVELSGGYEHGEPVGTWELRDANRALVRRVEFGAAFGTNTPPAIAGTEPDAHAAPEALSSAAEELERSPREAVALAARAFAKNGDRARFDDFLARHGTPLRTEHAADEAAQATAPERARPSSLLGALLAGGAPGMLLRTLASSLSGHAPAALAYFDASVALSPEQPLVALGRALLCIEHGDPAGALSATEQAEREASHAGESLRCFCRVTYGDFRFRPQQEGVGPAAEDLAEVEASQPLDAVLRTIELYATRLLRARQELLRRTRGTPSWLPPDTAGLLPHGPLELTRYVARIEDEGDDGTEISEVEVDETLELERSTRRLLTLARSDWAALGWLCWSAGLDRIERPERLVPRAEFAAATHQAMLRCWRAHDRLRTKGLVALAREVESFEWEGMPIDSVPPHLVELAAAEYLEVRAMFFWLMFPQNASPFQSDLRRV